MSNIPYWFSPPPEPTRRFLRWFATFVLVLSIAFTGVLATTAADAQGYLVMGGVFVLMSLALGVYAWWFAPADLGSRQRAQLVRSGQGTPRRRDLTGL